jgi:Na+/proline symporter
MLSILAYGVWSGLKVKTARDFFVAGGSQGFVPIIATKVATGIGSGMMIGWVGFGYVKTDILSFFLLRVAVMIVLPVSTGLAGR